MWGGKEDGKGGNKKEKFSCIFVEKVPGDDQLKNMLCPSLKRISCLKNKKKYKLAS
jgi:hypothetical protein